MNARPGFLARLALDRREARAWALYDWANSAMYTVVITAVFPIWFRQVATAGFDADTKRSLFSWTTTASLVVVALLGPFLGALSDTARIKKRLFAVFLAIGVAANGLLFFGSEGQPLVACVLFALVNIGAAGSFVFYDALLVSVAAESERDRLSTSAYALGYLGGGLGLGLCIALILRPAWFGIEISPEATLTEASLPARIGFLIVAAWWALFSIPFFRHVREPFLARESDEREGRHPARFAFTRLCETARELRALRHAFVFLLAYFVYSDGIGTVIRMATSIGEERGIDQGVLIASVLVAQLVGVPAALGFGKLAGRIGAKRSILIALVVYVGVALQAYVLSTAWEFLVLAGLVGLVQGGAQALSRSLFASLVPPHKTGEFFGFFSTLEKFAGLAGPVLFALAPSTGFAILGLLGFFALGAVLLMSVDVPAGRAAAREATRRATESAPPRPLEKS